MSAGTRMGQYFRRYKETVKEQNEKFYKAAKVFRDKKSKAKGKQPPKVSRESKLSRKISRASLKAAIRTKRISEFKGKGKVNYPTRWDARRKNWRRIHK